MAKEPIRATVLIELIIIRSFTRWMQAKTPYRGLLVDGPISQLSEDRLREENLSLNPAQLNREIESLRRELYRINRIKGNQVTGD